MKDQSGAADSSAEDPVSSDRLVGLSPTLELSDAGVTPGVFRSPHTAIVRPKVLLSRLTLRAASRKRARLAAFSFCVDQGLVRSWQSGDELNITRTGTGSLGLSTLRDGRLVAAVGEVTAVALGVGVAIRTPGEIMHAAEDVVRQYDPEFRFSEWPIEFHIGQERRLLYGGRPTIGDYEIWVEHGATMALSGVAECAAISHHALCPATAAVCSAQLLEYSDLTTMDEW